MRRGGDDDDDDDDVFFAVVALKLVNRQNDHQRHNININIMLAASCWLPLSSQL